MFSKKLFLFYLFSSFLLFSCNEQDRIEIEKSASAFDIKQGEASILQGNKHFIKAFKTGDSIEIGDIYTTNAALMIPNRPTISGRKNIVHYFSTTLTRKTSNISLNTIKIWGDSTILAEEGTYQISDQKENPLDKGKYIVLWKQETGNWKKYRDIWASDLPVRVIKQDSLKLNPNSAKTLKK